MSDVVITSGGELAASQALLAFGQAANQAVSLHTFDIFRTTLAASTLVSHQSAVKTFVRFLNSARVPVTFDGLWERPQAWVGVTFGVISAFKAWMLKEGFAISSVNQKLSIIKKHCELAAKSGAINANELALIKTIRSISAAKAIRNIDSQRDVTRIGTKKAKANTLSPSQIDRLISSIDDSRPIGARDKLLVCLFFEHGLRVGEVAILTPSSFDLSSNILIFDRPKVALPDQEHSLYERTRLAYSHYMSLVSRPSDFLLYASKRHGLFERTMSIRAMKRRVKVLGQSIGYENLSPHDGRHSLATYFAREGYTAMQLMDFFGWKSLTTAQSYIERNMRSNLNMTLWTVSE